MPPPNTRFPNWPPAQNLPASLSIVNVLFDGLLAFCYQGDANQGSCEVASLRAANHVRKLEVLVNNAVRFVSSNFTTASVGIRINRVENPPQVLFLKNETDQDFRWMLDLENEEFYPNPGPKNDNAVFTSKMVFRHGTFFTLNRTMYRLNRITRPFLELPIPARVPIGSLNAYDLDHPAKITAAQIALAANEYVSVVVDGTEVEQLRFDTTKQYEIRFTNLCEHGTPACDFEWNHWRESRRNDFHIHRRAVTLPTLGPRYSVMLGEVPQPAPPETPGKSKTSTEEAPCMGAGWGQTDGFPPPP